MMHLANCLLGLLAFSSFVFLSHQETLKCYHCRGDTNDECVTVEREISCFDTYRCATGYRFAPDNSHVINYAKGCLSADVCDGVKEFCSDYRGTKVCKTCCEGELCNSGKIKEPEQDAVNTKPQVKRYTGALSDLLSNKRRQLFDMFDNQQELGDDEE